MSAGMSHLDVGEVGEENFERRLERVLELVHVLVSELLGEHVADTLRVTGRIAVSERSHASEVRRRRWGKD
jgi:hypothetical protein